MDQSEKFWDKLACKYDERVQEYGEQTYRKTVEKTQKHLKYNDIVLDFACGTGMLTNKFSGDVNCKTS